MGPKIVEITVKWKNGSVTNHTDVNGIGLQDLPGLLDLTPEKIAEGASGTLEGLARTAVNLAISWAIGKLKSPFLPI